jgi:hypothetical protein
MVKGLCTGSYGARLQVSIKGFPYAMKERYIKASAHAD